MSKSQQGVKVWSWNFGNVCSWTKGTSYVCNTFSWELQIFCYNQAKFQPGSCGCQVSHETLISRILIYNSKPGNPIFTKFSACKRSSVEKMSGKFRHPEIVAMETVTDSFFIFNARYLSRGSIHCLEMLKILFSKTKGTFYVQNIIFSDFSFFCYYQAKLVTGNCGCTVVNLWYNQTNFGMAINTAARGG